MAEVWLAHRATLRANKTLAVKLLAPNLACKAQYREMFLEEARLSMLLNHSNVVQVFDVGEDRGECWIAMEWIDGANLAELQAALWGCGRSLPVDVAMYITGEVLRALDHAHNVAHDGAAIIVHRDVSPANIMLSLAGEVKLTDFGVARFGTEETSGVHVKGKLRYMAPEQLRGRSKAGTVDIFSVGAVLHEMLDGGKFRGAIMDEAQLIGTICAGTIPELVDRTGIPEQLDDLRRSMLAPEPEQRIASARVALQRLRRCPGYRDASHEVEALIDWYRSVESGSWGLRSSDSLAWIRTPRPGRTIGNRRRIAALSVALGGLCVGCLGVGFAVSTLESEPAPISVRGRIGRDEPPPIQLIQLRQLPVAAQINTPPDPVSVVETVEPPPSSPAAANVDMPTAIVPEPEPEPEPKIIHDRVEVKFVAGAFKFAYVKVGNRRLLIEPDGKLALTPGSHRVHVRFDADGEWTYFGKIHIRPSHTHVVKLVEPHGLDVQTLK